MEKIKMLVIPSDNTGVGHYRSIWPHQYIQEHYGNEFDIDIVASMPHENLEAFFRKYDLIHIHKQLDKECKIIDLIKFLDIPVILDIDDHYNLGDSHPMSLTAKKEKWAIPILNHLKKADYVTTTTPLFAEVLRKTNPNVYVLPNAVNTEDKQFLLPKTQETEKLRVGVICGSSHLKDLELINGIAKQIDTDKVQFVLCGFDTRGTTTIYKPNGEVERQPIKPQESVWCKYEQILTDNYNNVSSEHKEFLDKFISKVDDPFITEPYRRMWTRDIHNYATHYANVDVLIAPLKENEFNKVKSELKVIECGFTHTAFIGQNFGPYTLGFKSMIQKGGNIDEDGIVLLVDSAKNHKQWAKYINKLAQDRSLLHKLQNNLYDFVKDRYSMDTICKQRVELYKKIVNKGK